MNTSLVEDNIMHVHEVLRAVTRSSLSPPLRLLIMAMCADATRINFTTGVYTGSLACLAAATGYSESSIKRHWKALKASGWVDVQERSGLSSVITLTPLTPGQDEPGVKMTPPVKMTPGTPGQDDPSPPVILTPPYKNKQEDTKNEEEDAREVRGCTDGVRGHDAMVDASPSTCRDGVEETQPIREGVSQGDVVERKVRVQRIVWDILKDIGVTEELASDLAAASEQELKRRILPGMKMFARAVCLTDWSDGEVEHYVLERVNSFMHRDIQPSRWLSMMSSREDMADYNTTLIGGPVADQPFVMPDPPRQPSDDLPRDEMVRIAEGPMHDLMVQMQADIDRDAAERDRREDERRARAQMEYERMRRELGKEVV